MLLASLDTFEASDGIQRFWCLRARLAEPVLPWKFQPNRSPTFFEFHENGVDRNMCYTCSFRQSGICTENSKGRPYVIFLNPRQNETYNAGRENERRYTVRKVKYYFCMSTQRVVPKHEFYSFGVGHLRLYWKISYNEGASRPNDRGACAPECASFSIVPCTRVTSWNQMFRLYPEPHHKPTAWLRKNSWNWRKKPKKGKIHNWA